MSMNINGAEYNDKGVRVIPRMVREKGKRSFEYLGVWLASKYVWVLDWSKTVFMAWCAVGV